MIAIKDMSLRELALEARLETERVAIRKIMRIYGTARLEDMKC